MEPHISYSDDSVTGWRANLARALPAVLAVVLVGALGSLLYLVSAASSERDKALEWQRHSYEVINLARAVDGSIAKSESTLARYVISMDKNVGLVFQSQWRHAGTELTALKRAIRDNPHQRALLAKLRIAYTERGEVLSNIALRTNYKQRMGSLAAFHDAGKADNLKQINILLDQIIAHEIQRLRERNALVSESEVKTERLADTWQLIGLILLVGVIFAAWAMNAAVRDRRNARRVADAEAIRASQLELAVEARTREIAVANERLKQEVTERIQAEESLRQLHKMEAVGQLTGGIAHDFNNMLAVVVGGLELAKRKLHDDPEHAERHLNNAMEGANRASALTRRLLAFARSEPLLPTEVDPDTLVTGMIDLIDRTIGDQIQVETACGADGWHIWVDRHQLENAILNLAVNARDAMEGRGTMTISTGQVRLKAREIGECAAGDYVIVSVRDTGCGMAPDVLERAFEPFFTTKPMGKGTGLGLSQIFGFVGQSHGEIRILSEAGKGTHVQLFLPRRTLALMTPTVSDPSASHMNQAVVPSIRILVVEDDPRVLSATLDSVAELGHHAIACDHPAKAIALLEAHDGIGLILSDVLMPDMTGPEMITALPDQFRNIPVLFVTGFAGDVAEAEMFEGHQVLRKPYTLAALSTAIGVALSEQPRSQTAAAAE